MVKEPIYTYNKMDPTSNGNLLKKTQGKDQNLFSKHSKENKSGIIAEYMTFGLTTALI
jgi:hypothetical protein